jgi:regulator of protease activity HflC (stomatin/prohibitin superfamily)
MATNWNSLKHKSSMEERDAVHREARAELQRIGFGKLRQARKQTQVAVAEKLKMQQGAVSRLEKQTDLLLSTLGGYVGALGGRLELRAVFPDGDFVIDTLAEKRPVRKASKVVPKVKRSA